MKWRWRWPWHRNGHETQQIRDEAERRLAAAQKMTPRVRRLAEALPQDEFAERIARAFRAPPYPGGRP